MQQPSVGRIVLVPTEAIIANQPGPLGQTINNGADVAPAIITRVWSDTLLNVRVLLDGSDQSPAKTSIKLFETPEDYAEARDAGAPYGCYWPPRV
jgi:hypothetical protein